MRTHTNVLVKKVNYFIQPAVCCILLLVLNFGMAGCSSLKSESDTDAEQPEETLSLEDKLFEIDEDVQKYLLLEALLPLPKKVPADIVGYFRQLEEMEVASPLNRHNSEAMVDDVRNTVKLLQQYATRQRKYYPVEEVRSAINILSGYAHYGAGHGETIYPNRTLLKITNYMNHFIAVAAMLSPSLDYLSAVKDAGETVGILQFMDWGHTGNIQSYLFCRSGKQINAQLMPHLDDKFIENIFRLTDEKGNVYYLFSHRMSDWRFWQVLYVENDGKLEYVTDCNRLPSCDKEDTEILFNPRTLEWNYCYNDQGQLHKIPGAGYLKLHLDGMNSTFEIVE